MKSLLQCAGLMCVTAVLATRAMANDGATDRPFFLYLSNDQGLSVIDGRTRAVVAEIPAGARCVDVHVDAGGRLIYAAGSGHDDGFAVIDAVARKFIRKLDARPGQFAITPDIKKIYIVNQDAGTLNVIDL